MVCGHAEVLSLQITKKTWSANRKIKMKLSNYTFNRWKIQDYCLSFNLELYSTFIVNIESLRFQSLLLMNSRQIWDLGFEELICVPATFARNQTLSACISYNSYT
jgi:hypothetical protein